jgi:hypothetical protein
VTRVGPAGARSTRDPCLKPRRPEAAVPPFNLKEINMNETSQPEQQPELEVIDLGDAKALTMGISAQVHLEDNPAMLARKQ